MSGYTPLFGSIVRSSIWDEDAKTCKVWVTMLALCDAQGIVEGSLPGLAHEARVTRQECATALRILMAPDPDSRTPDDEGRRIREVDGGWLVLNHAKYRKKAKSRAAYLRSWRAQKKKAPQTPKEEKNPYSYSNSDTHETVAQHSETHETCFTIPPDKQRWKDIAFQVGLTDAEAEQAYANFEGNDWERANKKKIEYWRQVPGILRYWRNNRGQFERQQQGKLPYMKTIPGHNCDYKGPEKRRCGLPAVYQAQTEMGYDYYRCAEHMPEKVKESYGLSAKPGS